MTTPETRHLASELIGPVHQAGVRIMAHYGTAEVERKTDNSPVTVADREADAVLVDALTRIAPEIPVISEESSPTARIDPDAPFFLVDPLDGTKEFINARTEFTVNVALVVRRMPCFGIVYAPALGAIYVTLTASEVVRIEADPKSPPPTLESADRTALHTRIAPPEGLTAAVSRSHMDDATRDFLKTHAIADTFASGSSLKFCCIAEGKADVYPRFGRTMEWDIAAGHAVLGAAGGTVVDESGSPLTYGKIERGYDNPGFVAWGRRP
jgi:3'(2'), 5'-bisphosphate nucleotidase